MKTWVITLGYVPARIFQESMRAFYSTISNELDLTHVFVDQHYPVNKDINRHLLYSICAKYNISILNPKRNLGLHDGFNWAMSHLPIKPNDAIIGFDPDSSPVTPGWDKALVTALSDWRLTWASLMSPRIAARLPEIGFINHRVLDVKVWILLNAVANSICAWNAQFLTDIGGISELMRYYGHLEASMFPKLKALNKEWVVLPDYKEDDAFRNSHDPEYTRWKWYYAHRKIITMSFDEYVAQGSPILELEPVPGELP